MMQSPEVKELFAAVSKVQSELRGAKKDSANPFFKSSYADLEACWEAARPVLAKHNLSVIQTMDHTDGQDFLLTTLGHTSGQWITSKLRLMPEKQNPQALGSAITYNRRYAFAAIIGLIQTDDDGEAAMNRTGQQPSNMAIAPKQPTADDGVIGTGGYRIPFGKFKQRSLEEVGPSELQNYISYLKSESKASGKPMNSNAVEFIKRAEEYVFSTEN
jgi:hypothetical protein